MAKPSLICFEKSNPVRYSILGCFVLCPEAAIRPVLKTIQRGLQPEG